MLLRSAYEMYSGKERGKGVENGGDKGVNRREEASYEPSLKPQRYVAYKINMIQT